MVPFLKCFFFKPSNSISNGHKKNLHKAGAMRRRKNTKYVYLIKKIADIAESMLEQEIEERKSTE